MTPTALALGLFMLKEGIFAPYKQLMYLGSILNLGFSLNLNLTLELVFEFDMI
jgi:hypothetical protein